MNKTLRSRTFGSLFLLVFLILLSGCSSAPAWMSGEWEIFSFGEKDQDVMLEGLATRYYWVIEKGSIIGYVKEGWDGTSYSILSGEYDSSDKDFVQMTEAEYKVTSSSHNECTIQYISGSELYPLVWDVYGYTVKEGDKLIFRKTASDKIAIDRKVDMKDTSVQDQARMMLFKRSSSLVEIKGETYHRINLIRR